MSPHQVRLSPVRHFLHALRRLHRAEFHERHVYGEGTHYTCARCCAPSR